MRYCSVAVQVVASPPLSYIVHLCNWSFHVLLSHRVGILRHLQVDVDRALLAHGGFPMQQDFLSGEQFIDLLQG